MPLEEDEPPPSGGNTTQQRHYPVVNVRTANGLRRVDTTRALGAPPGGHPPALRPLATGEMIAAPDALVLSPAAPVPSASPPVDVIFRLPGVGAVPARYDAVIDAGGWLVLIDRPDSLNFRPYEQTEGAVGVEDLPHVVAEVRGSRSTYNLFADPAPFGYDYAGRRYYCVRHYPQTAQSEERAVPSDDIPSGGVFD